MANPKNKIHKASQKEDEQMKFRFLGILFVLLAFAAAVSLIYYWQMAYQPIPGDFMQPMHLAPKTGTYTNTEYGFQFNYDKNYDLDTSGNQANFFKHAAKSLISAVLPQSLYPKTNFGSANLTVAVQPQSSESNCIAAAKTYEVNGVIFHESDENQGAAGTNYQTRIYRVFHGQDCMEVSQTIGIANIGNYTPGAVAEVDANAVWKRLDEMLKTFKFSDPNSSTSSMGTLLGHVTIGPICPVEQAGHPCQATPEMNMARQVGVFGNNGLVASQHLDGNGNYKFSLPAGTYTLKASGMRVDQLSMTVGTVTIKSGQTTTSDFNIDTGIR
ncbi:MAG: carboxypeptidase-like regulatory domain-containing protein [Candidatus Doudnabacteria bacterium]